MTPDNQNDHRNIGKRLNYFHFQDNAPGMTFWNEYGCKLWQIIENYIRNEQQAADYQEIKTPQIIDYSLWEQSGHSTKYDTNIFKTYSEKKVFAIKPMNCPGHIQVFNRGIKSYKELPIRYVEFGCCHRNEPSGALYGLFRVRSMVQDDGHIFCAIEDISNEINNFINLAFKIYKNFGFENIDIYIATMPKNYIGHKDIWKKSESILSDTLTYMNIPFKYLHGEGAFYGPKIELHLTDCHNRKWQCGTIQIDFNMPERLNACYISKYNTKETPIMLHRAVLGSFERFIGILLEEYKGKLPFLLSPVQFVLLSISEKNTCIEYINIIYKKLNNFIFRSKIDLSNEHINIKIRKYINLQIPYIIIIGNNEYNSQTISVRSRDYGNLNNMNFEEFIKFINIKNNNNLKFGG
jgi:threonyl-tRNA synthetase